MNADKENDRSKNTNKNKGRKKNIARAVENLVKDIVEDLGFGLWNVEYYKDAAEWILEITIERTDGNSVSIDDCEKVHRAVDPVIDEADPIENSYSLQISSPGLNRELKKDSHFERYIDREVEVRLFVKHELLREKSFAGTFLKFGEDIFEFAVNIGSDKNNENNKSNKNNKSDKSGDAEQPPQNCVIALQKKEIAHIYAHDDVYI